MKNIFLKVMLFAAVSNFVNADWKLNAIYNESDLHLDGAYRLKNGKHKSTFIKKKIENAQSKSVMMIDYKVVTDATLQGYLCISLHDEKNEQYELCFDSQTSHAIEWQRSKAKKIAPMKSDVDDFMDDTMKYARVFLKHQGHNVGKDSQSYDDASDGEFDLIIKGLRGAYSLELAEVAR